MKARQTSILFLLLLCFTISVLSDTNSDSRFCNTDVAHGSRFGSSSYELELSSEIQLGTNTFLLGVYTQVQAGLTITYSYFVLNTATASNTFKFRIIKSGINRQKLFDQTSATEVTYGASSSTLAVNLVILKNKISDFKSGVIVIQDGTTASLFNLYYVDHTATLNTASLKVVAAPLQLTVADHQTIADFSAITANIRKTTAAAGDTVIKVLTKYVNLVSSAQYIKLYSCIAADCTTTTAVTSAANVFDWDNFLFTCQVGVLMIDSGLANSGLSAGPLALTSKTANILALTDADVGNLLRSVDKNLNADIVAIAFEKTFIVAAYNKASTSSKIIFANVGAADFALATSVVPLLSKPLAASTTLKYETDLSTGIIQFVNTPATSTTAYASADIFFVDSFLSASQSYYSILGTTATNFLAYAFAEVGETVRISLSLQTSSTPIQVTYNVYIISSTTIAASIYKYSTGALTVATATKPNAGTAPTLANMFEMTLGDDSFTELINNAAQEELFTLNAYCACSKIIIREFICFGTDECTVALRNTINDCTTTYSVAI